MRKPFHSAIISAAFLMATSAIGPGFLTQTAVFTNQLAASFGFVILVSIILDIGAQMNIWSVLTMSGKKAQDVANDVLPGLGYLLSLLVVVGGLAFNIGNLAGCGLGVQVLFGISAEKGAAISAVIAVAILLAGNSGKVMDIVTKTLGMVMIGLTLYVAFASSPPLGEALYRTIVPEQIDTKAIITLVGGTVGGYITFAGGHRLLESGVKGREGLPEARRSAVTGILVASTMRVLLFLAALGVVSKGLELQQNNPAASIFKLSAGIWGFKLFGVVMWCAAITSVIGSAYTSFSFINGFHSSINKLRVPIISIFIISSAMIFMIIGQPVRILLYVGMLNGFILPLALAIMLVAAYKMKKNDYRHPLWLYIFGIAVIAATAWMSIKAIVG